MYYFLKQRQEWISITSLLSVDGNVIRLYHICRRTELSVAMDKYGMLWNNSTAEKQIRITRSCWIQKLPSSKLMADSESLDAGESERTERGQSMGAKL